MKAPAPLGGLGEPMGGFFGCSDEVDPAMYREAVPEAHYPERSGNSPPLVDHMLVHSMVGMGELCENSGQFRVGACLKCGHEVVMPMKSCGRIECPRCVKTWARRASERTGCRAFAPIHALVSKHHPRHISFELENLSWKEAKKKALALGATGGILVLHAHRIKPQFAQMFEIMAERCSANRYDIVRESALGLDALEFSPHAHAICYGRFVDVEKGSGVYKYRNIRKLNSQAACEKTLSYLLGHSALPPWPSKNAVRYFGICSPQKIKPSWSGKCRSGLDCPCCGGVVIDKESREEIFITRYIALGWHIILPRPRVTGGAGPPVAPNRVWGTNLPPGLCTSQ